jgi:WD40-like Beta Propeller Repeat
VQPDSAPSRRHQQRGRRRCSSTNEALARAPIACRRTPAARLEGERRDRLLADAQCEAYDRCWAVWPKGRVRIAIRTPGKHSVPVWVTFAVTAVVFVFAVAGAEAAFPGVNGRIAFTSEEFVWPPPEPGVPSHPGVDPDLVSSRIETVLPSGRKRRVLATCPAGARCFDSAPAWSRSGRWLAFVSRWEGDSSEMPDRIALMRSDGSGLHRLPALTLGHLTPAWSPDGRWLSFASRASLGLYTARSNGTGLRFIVQDAQPWSAWSINGMIAFAANTPGATSPFTGIRYQFPQIYTARPDGSGRRQVTRHPWYGSESPDWSPHAIKLAYHSHTGVGSDIYVIGADGRGRRRVTYRGGSEAAWSPDGKYIAFIRNHDLYVVRSSGRGLRRLVDAPDQDPDHPNKQWTELSSPSWQPLAR